MQVDPDALDVVRSCIREMDAHKSTHRASVFAGMQACCGGAADTLSARVQPAIEQALRAGAHAGASVLCTAQSELAADTEPVLAPAFRNALKLAADVGALAQQVGQHIVWACGLHRAAQLSPPFAAWCSTALHPEAMADQASASMLQASAEAVKASDGSHSSPSYQVTIAERDAILTERIWQVAVERPGARVVAGVGADYAVPGILRRWQHAGSAQSVAAAY